MILSSAGVTICLPLPKSSTGNSLSGQASPPPAQEARACRVGIASYRSIAAVCALTGLRKP
jgi:hypothetical protein